ncbi:MAG: PEP-CTERM sorting domain-containing protein [Planctomycetota bacterium]
MTSQSQAGIMFNESARGDIQNTPDLGSVVAGENMIIGTLIFGSDPVDSFTFSLDDGLRIDDIALVVDPLDIIALNPMSSFDGSSSTDPLWIHDFAFDISRSYSWVENEFSGTSVVPPIEDSGSYRIDHLIGNRPGSYNYTVTISVSATQAVIPEPTSFAIFGAGLLGTFGLGRRRKPR